jgi:hypothetical protein
MAKDAWEARDLLAETVFLIEAFISGKKFSVDKARELLPCVKEMAGLGIY